MLKAIRDINGHFIHGVDVINIDSFDPSLIVFLRESFALALIQACHTLKQEEEIACRKKKANKENRSGFQKEFLLTEKEKEETPGLRLRKQLINHLIS